MLTTPIGREDLLLGKALAALIPSVAISYAIYAFFIVCVELVAQPGIASALIQGPELLAQLFFTALFAGFSILIGTAISARSTDVRTAQSLGFLATVPLAAVAALIAFKVIPAKLGLGIGLAALLLFVDGARLAGHLGDVRP